MSRISLATLTAAARSGLRRYPRHLWQSVTERGARRNPSDPLLPECEGSDGSPRICPLNGADIGAMWIGHATVLLRIGGTTILTDPVFSNRIGWSVGAKTFGIRRLVAPSIAPHLLPPIDLVLISHAHFDHLDRPSLMSIANARTTVITAARTARLIPAGFEQVIELGWNQELRFRDVRIQALRPAHWGARTAVDHRRGFNSYLLESPHSSGKRPYKVLFAGDTANTDSLDRAGPIDLGIFGIGAYNPWEHAHATPEQVWSMFSRVAPSKEALLLPVHHSTFELSDEHPDEPMQRLLRAADGHLERIVCRDIGSRWAHGCELPSLKSDLRHE